MEIFNNSIVLISVGTEQISLAETRGDLFSFSVENSVRLVGNVYVGRVETIVRGMDAAFVDIGLARNALIYAGDLIGNDSGDGDCISGNPIGVDRKAKKADFPSIEKLLKPNDRLLVQIERAPVGDKGARVGGRISLSGRFLVLEHGAKSVGVSRRIEKASERERLRKIAENLRPHGCGVIVRTEAAGVDEDELGREMSLLTRRLESIFDKAKTSDAPALLHRETGLMERWIRDRMNENVAKIVVDSEIEYSILRELVETLSPQWTNRVHWHDSPEPIFEFYGVSKEIESLGERVVALKSGGSLAIDEAEALTAIDVNTGSFVGKKRLAETVLQTNLEAAQEAARQLRLRNIGGIIVIDFIDMERARDRVELMETLENALKEDHTRTRILQLSPLGLVEMTRQREGDSLRGSTTQICPYCDGDGRIETPSQVAAKVSQQVRSVVAARRAKADWRGDFAVLVVLHPTSATSFLGDDRGNVRALENSIEAPVFLRVGTSLHHEARVVEVGETGDFEAALKLFAVGARFEIAPDAFFDDDSRFAVVNRVLVRLEKTPREESPQKNGSLWIEVTDCGRAYVEVRVLAQGEPATKKLN